MNNQKIIFTIFWVIFHLIGIWLINSNGSVPDSTYVTILVSGLIVFYSELDRKTSLVNMIILIVLGYLIELIGVQTGLLFGSYSYYESMGPGLFGTPILIGFTWYVTITGALSVSSKIFKSKTFKVLFAGFLAVLLDVFLEQVAIKFKLWSWEGDEVPLYNYICWYIFSCLFALIIQRKNVQINKMAIIIYCIWFGFFLVLTYI